MAAATAVNGLLKSLGPAPASMEETTGALLAMREGLDDVDQLFRDQSTWDYGVDGLADAMDRLINPSLMARLNDFAGEVMSFGSDEGSAGRERLITQFNSIGDSLALMVQNGNADLAARQFDQISQQWTAAGGDLQDLRDLMPGYVDALQEVENQQALTSDSGIDLTNVYDAVVGRFGTGYENFEAYAAALGLSEEGTDKLRDRIMNLGQSLTDFIDPFGTYTALLEEKRAAEQEAAQATADATADQTDSWEDYADDVGVSLDEYMTRLQDQLTATNNWQTNMLILAGRVSQGTLDELARLGPEGAEYVAQLVTGSDAQLAQLDDMYAQRAEDAVGAWGLVLEQAGPVLAAVAAVAGAGVRDALSAELAAGTTTVADIANQYGISLANGINPVLQALGSRAVSVVRGVFGFNSADGNLVDYFAGGGFEDHVATIAPAGSWRVWAEPETGGPALVPVPRPGGLAAALAHLEPAA